MLGINLNQKIISLLRDKYLQATNLYDTVKHLEKSGKLNNDEKDMEIKYQKERYQKLNE